MKHNRNIRRVERGNEKRRVERKAKPVSPPLAAGINRNRKPEVKRTGRGPKQQERALPKRSSPYAVHSDCIIVDVDYGDDGGGSEPGDDEE